MTAIVDLPAPPRRSRAIKVLRWMRHDMRAVLSIAFLSLMVIVSIFAPVLAPYSPVDQD
jgi:peptide/nickel transport system permease protein